MGRKGLTDTFVDNLSIALKANEFVKVSAEHKGAVGL